ncbi:MAG: bifunctional adenosylcobinamide kinase/adenosylcobinamide-phosphate guanylyltransferase [Gammaproteobacteria bacterium]|nr:bifunctional adenosylcobinamide kinase/adenosylcobinamide-phosphate guanylyltransferase [Gammaproteobacteria bacterium]
MTTLILGGVRSGKSRLAERLAVDSGLAVTCIATATAEDAAMRARIAAHRARRPATWNVIEEPLALAAALRAQAGGRCIIVDCLTLWLTNLLLCDDPDALARERAALLEILPALEGNIVLVGNETNMGVMPTGDLARRYCDEAGCLHQDLARICDRVILTVAGLPHYLKGGPP